MTVQFYRFLIAGIATLLMICLYLRNLRKVIIIFQNIGMFGIIAGMIFGGSNMLFTSAIQSTAAANVLVINASNSIFASIFGYFLLGELIPLRTLITIIVSFGAIILVFSSEFSHETSVDSIKGNLLAVGAAMTLGLFLPLCRYNTLKVEHSNQKVSSLISDDQNVVGVIAETSSINDEILEVLCYNVIAFFFVAEGEFTPTKLFT